MEREEKHRSEYSVVLQIVRMKSDPSVDGSGGSTVRIGGIREEMISRRKGIVIVSTTIMICLDFGLLSFP